MRSAEVALVRRVGNINADVLDGKPNMAQAVRSHWPVSIVKRKEHMDKQDLKHLVDSYAHLNVKDGSS